MAKKHDLVAAFHKRVFESMQPDVGYTASQLAAKVGVSAPTVRGALKHLCEIGSVKRRLDRKLMVYSRPTTNRTPGAYIAPWKPLQGYGQTLYRHAELAMEGR